MQDQFLQAGEQPNTALVTAGELHIPAGVMVRLDVTSNEPLNSPENVDPKDPGPGVIHNFWVPALAGKIYAIPGHITHLNLEADAVQGQRRASGHLLGAVQRVLRPLPRQHALQGGRRDALPTSRPGSPSSAPSSIRSPPPTSTPSRWRTRATRCSTAAAAARPATRCRAPRPPGQVGPNLTHLQARKVFAGAIFALNDNNLRMWLRNPQAVKPGANMRIRQAERAGDHRVDRLLGHAEVMTSPTNRGR